MYQVSTDLAMSRKSPNRGGSPYMEDWWWRALSGWCHPRLVVLGSIRKQAEQVSKRPHSIVSASAPVSRILLCLSSCPEFL